MPKPRKGEKESDFINRCMGDEEAKKTKPNADDRLGFCFGLFKAAKENDDWEPEEGEKVE